MATAIPIHELIVARLTGAARLTPTTISFKQASQISGLSESHLRFLASDRGECKLATSKVGRKRLVSYESLQRLIQS
jgi:hypothetical protein